MKTYGSVSLVSKQRWEIRCEPHVSIRLKRVFPKINISQVGGVFLATTPENAFDLKWFLQRYPMEVNDKGRLEELVGRFEEKKTLVESLAEGIIPSTINRDFKLKLPLRHYQEIASLNWLASKGLLVADEVGLGKTITSLAALTLEPKLLPSLIVVQTHLQDQWVNEEIPKFTDFTTHKLRKGIPYDILKYTKGKFPDVIVTNYHKLAGWVETLAPTIKSIIFDEIQELRHSGTAKYNAAYTLSRSIEYKIGISGTPIHNYGGEMYNVLDIITPGSLGEKEEFDREWCSYSFSGKSIIKDPKAFGTYLRDSGLMLRRTREEVGRELPPLTIVPHYIDADEAILNKIKGKAIELAKLILAKTEDYKGQKMQAAGEFDIKMRQATGIAKAPYVADFVNLLVEETGEKIVLFGWHREVYSIWLERLSHLNPVMYTGTESAKEKEEAKNRFIQGDSQVMIISLRSGVGLNGLQDASHIAIIGEMDYSPSIHAQNIGRLHRDKSNGEKCSPTIAYFMISNHGTDPIMVQILGLKKNQSEFMLNPKLENVEIIQTDPEHIKKLAQLYLDKHSNNS